MEGRGIYEEFSGTDAENSKEIRDFGCNASCFKSSTFQENGKDNEFKVEMMDESVNQSTSDTNNINNLFKRKKPCHRHQCNANNVKTLDKFQANGEEVKKMKLNQEKSGIKECGCAYGNEERLSGCPQDKFNDENFGRENFENPQQKEVENSLMSSGEMENNLNKFDLTSPGFKKILVDIENQARTLDQQLTSLNDKIISDLPKNSETDINNGINSISYRRVREVEDIHNLHDGQGEFSSLEELQNTSDFQPPLVSTPGKKIDMNHNEIIDASRSPKNKLQIPRIRVTKEKVFTVKKSPSSSNQKIEIIREESIVNIEDSSEIEKKGKSKIPTRSNNDRLGSAGSQFSRSQVEKKSKSSTPESVQNPRKIRFDSFSFKNPFKKKSQQSLPSAPETQDISTQDPPQNFYDLAEDGRSYEFSDSTSSKNSRSRHHKNCHMPCAKGYCPNLPKKF